MVAHTVSIGTTRPEINGVGRSDTDSGMDFLPDPALVTLEARATEVGRRGAARRRIREDGWLIGYDPDFSRELAAEGWIGMTWPAEVGGGGRSGLERSVVYEALIGEGAPLAASYFADRQVGPTLLQFASDEQISRWIPGILAGESMWCIGLSEPDAGSDVASIRTRAVRSGAGGGWVVSGQKVWTSGARDADWCYLIARTDPDAPPHRGLSEFVVAMDSPGVSVSPIVDATGDAHFASVTFEEVVVPASHLIGSENGSFSQVMRQMEHERGGIDRLVSNRRLLLDVLAVADTGDPLVRQRVAALETDYRLGRLLVLREVTGQAPRGFSAATKTFCTEYEQRVASFCASVLGAGAPAWSGGPSSGAAGLAERVARGVVYAPAYTLMGGTTQVLRNIIAERVLGLPRHR